MSSTEPKTLSEFIEACGGVSAVAKAMNRSDSSVYGVRQQGVVPFGWGDGLRALAEKMNIEMRSEWVAPYRAPGPVPGASKRRSGREAAA